MKKQLELLKLLRDATRAGRISWKRRDPSSHIADFGGLRFLIRFKYPLLAGGEGSDAEVVEVTADSTIWTFYIGTEGFDLVGQILTAADPELREWNRKNSARLEKTIERIRRETSLKKVRRRAITRQCRNSVGVETLSERFPRVARASQPWALGCNPVGIVVRCPVN